MNKDLQMLGALANTDGETTTEELLDFLTAEIDGLAAYRMRPPTAPNIRVKAAVDWLTIIEGTASVVGLGQALWAAYQKFIVPLKNKRPSAGLFVQIKDRDENFVQFFLGDEYKDEEVFIESFTEKVETLRSVETKDGKVEMKESVERSGHWVRSK